MEIVVNGKKVVLRNRLSAKLGWDVLINKADVLGKNWKDIQFDDLAALLSVAVESWELEGDPSDISVYANLDMFDEFVPLAMCLSEWLNTRMQPSKNSSGRR